MKPIHIFILCYNEEKLIRHTINFYRKRFPNCAITIFDNESTDSSRDIALSLNCNVIIFNSNNIQNEFIQSQVKIDGYRRILDDSIDTWVILIDMDEWLCINKGLLEEEEKNGTTILKCKGYEMIGESKRIDLSDIDLEEIYKYVENDGTTKQICFLYPKAYVECMIPGGHKIIFGGINNFSKNVYKIKHMKFLGKDYLIDIYKIRYNRTNLMRSIGIDWHYTDDIDKLTTIYNDNLKNHKVLYQSD